MMIPVWITVAFFLTRRWPDAIRLASRVLAVAIGASLLCVVAAGWAHDLGSVASTHNWSSHVIFILAWHAVPFAIGVALGRPGGHSLAASARVAGLSTLLGVIFLASITGYLGPSYGQVYEMSLVRFRVLHFWV